MADGIESVLDERRVFPPAGDFSSRAHVSSMAAYEELCKKAEGDPDGFWRDRARGVSWITPFKTVLDESKHPFVKWFVGGQLNLSANCLDRHLDKHAHKPAIVWEGEPGDSRTLTYAELHREVCRAANALKTLGVNAGDRVVIYLPMIPELAISLLACARIGATHSVIFGGFSAEAIRDRVRDSGAKVIITADGGWRRGKIVPLK